MLVGSQPCSAGVYAKIEDRRFAVAATAAALNHVCEIVATPQRFPSGETWAFGGASNDHGERTHPARHMRAVYLVAVRDSNLYGTLNSTAEDVYASPRIGALESWRKRAGPVARLGPEGVSALTGERPQQFLRGGTGSRTEMKPIYSDCVRLRLRK